jgi:hypothetical protein
MHLAFARQGGAESRSVDRDRVVVGCVWCARHRLQEALCASAGDCGRHFRLGPELVVHAGAFDAQLSGRLAEAEAGVAAFADTGLGHVLRQTSQASKIYQPISR